jgi:hypothetical protein
MSFATGRDQATNDLIASPLTNAEFAIPSVCYMEAFSTFESMRKIQKKFVEEFQNKILDCDRGIVWTDRVERLELLRLSSLEIERTFERFRFRLIEATNLVCAFAKPIQISSKVLKTSTDQRIIKDMTDNLILATILDHASSQPDRRPKAFLSENSKDFNDKTDAGLALDEAGIKYFRQTQVCRDWLEALTKIPPG